MTDWPRTAVLGAGAVGCYFGGMLARAGAPVTVYGRPGSKSEHMRSLAERGIEIDGVSVRQTFPVEVGEQGPELAEAELVLVCVKSMDTDVVARSVREHLSDGALVASLQNGVDNADRMEAAGVPTLPTVVYVAAAIEKPGVIKHRGRGDLIIGHPTRRADAERVAAWFEAAEVPCPVSDDIRRDQWQKLALNSMTNSTSAVTGATYGALAEFEPTWELALAIGREAIDVAAAEGTELELEQLVELGRKVISGIGNATSSTQQDIAAGRRTEIDALNGFIARRGAELGVPTPTNDAITALVKLRERTPQ